MKRTEIEKLEPKYAGNRKHLTEGEAAEILRDQENEPDDDEFGLEDIPPLGLIRMNRPF